MASIPGGRRAKKERLEKKKRLEKQFSLVEEGGKIENVNYYLSGRKRVSRTREKKNR